jgi:hypothetical protein
MIKNRLKIIILAIATVAIVLLDNIGFGSFDRVDARPTFSTDGSQIQDIQTAPTTRWRNYRAALNYSATKDSYNFIDSLWNEGGKDLEKKFREAIDGKRLDRGDRIHDVIVKFNAINIDREFFSFSPSGNKGTIVREVTEKVQFKTTSPATLGSERESTFLGEFDLKIELKIFTTNQSKNLDDKISVYNLTVGIRNIRLDSNADDTTASLVSRFYNKQFEDVISQINGDSSIKSMWAGYIESVLQRTVPVNILLTR